MGPWIAASTLVLPLFHSADPSQLCNVESSQERGRSVAARESLFVAIFDFRVMCKKDPDPATC
jgi:hypothetical protein